MPNAPPKTQKKNRRQSTEREEKWKEGSIAYSPRANAHPHPPPAAAAVQEAAASTSLSPLSVAVDRAEGVEGGVPGAIVFVSREAAAIVERSERGPISPILDDDEHTGGENKQPGVGQEEKKQKLEGQEEQGDQEKEDGVSEKSKAVAMEDLNCDTGNEEGNVGDNQDKKEQSKGQEKWHENLAWGAVMIT